MSPHMHARPLASGPVTGRPRLLPSATGRRRAVPTLPSPRATPPATGATPPAGAGSASVETIALPTPPVLTRRAVLSATAALSALGATATPACPAAARGFSNYVKKRGRADPLSSFVPPVLDARAQLARLREQFGDPAEARRLLRSGAFEGLRDNVRAVGEYAVAAASAAGGDPASTSSAAAAQLAPDFFAAVQALDFVFFKAARDGAAVPEGDAQARLDAAVGALDALLATVPADVLAGARAVVEASAGGGGGADGGKGGAAAATALAQVLPQAVGG